jgi:hypothetical protein
MKFMAIARGDPALKRLLTVINERNEVIIPVFNDTDKCVAYTQKYGGTTPIVFDAKGMVAILQAAEIVEGKQCWVALNPEAEKQHECYTTAEFQNLYDNRKRRSSKNYRKNKNNGN